MSFHSIIYLFVLFFIIVVFVIPPPVKGIYEKDRDIPDISSIAVPLKAPLFLSESYGDGSMIDRLEKKIQLEENNRKNDDNPQQKINQENIIIHVAKDDDSIPINDADKKSNEPSPNAIDRENQGRTDANYLDQTPDEIHHRELGAGRALVNAVWFIVIITVIPCLLCTCLLTCLCYVMEWIPNPFSGDYYSSGPHGGSGIWGTGTRTGTGWYGPGSNA